MYSLSFKFSALQNNYNPFHLDVFFKWSSTCLKGCPETPALSFPILCSTQNVSFVSYFFLPRKLFASHTLHTPWTTLFSQRQLHLQIYLNCHQPAVHSETSWMHFSAGRLHLKFWVAAIHCTVIVLYDWRSSQITFPCCFFAFLESTQGTSIMPPSCGLQFTLLECCIYDYG